MEMEIQTKPDTTKRERKWKVPTDRPGDYALIAKSELHVDDRYQRRHRPEKIQKMASDWSWVACGAIIVALRPDATWFVIDGQHRVLAAQLRDDIKFLPCLVFDMEEVVEEARGFLKSNTQRRPMLTIDRFKALLMTEDHTARVANELIVSAGLHLTGGASPHAFSAVQSMLNCARDGEETLRRIWPVVASTCANKARITSQLISAFWWLEKHLPPGVSLASTHWKNRAISIGPQVIEEAITQASNFYGGGKGYRNCALGLAKALNHGLRNKLTHTITPPEEGKPDVQD